MYLFYKNQYLFLLKVGCMFGGARVAQSVKPQTVDLSSGHNLTICEFEPHIRVCADSVEPAWNSLPPSLSALPSLLSLFQKISENNKK